MKRYAIIVEAADDMDARDVRIAVEGAFEYAADDYNECIKANEGCPEDQQVYLDKLGALENITIKEVSEWPE